MPLHWKPAPSYAVHLRLNPQLLDTLRDAQRRGQAASIRLGQDGAGHVRVQPDPCIDTPFLTAPVRCLS